MAAARFRALSAPDWADAEETVAVATVKAASAAKAVEVSPSTSIGAAADAAEAAPPWDAAASQVSRVKEIRLAGQPRPLRPKALGWRRDPQWRDAQRGPQWRGAGAPRWRDDHGPRHLGDR
eukprot:2541195-Pyramimonas_sp.AAC.1